MSESRWQFSLRSLLVLTTIVSICLAIGIHFAGFMFVLVAVGVTQVAMMLFADWLIRPENRRALAFATAGSWLVFGSGLFVAAIFDFVSAIMARRNGWSVHFAILLALAALICFYVASIRWRKLAPRIEVSDQESA